ncbi:MAG: hypothetical protein HYS04_02165 [Acidobacteria bacterium]|nr:hypothetical protein [Acidobacteriota bacterium]
MKALIFFLVFTSVTALGQSNDLLAQVRQQENQGKAMEALALLKRGSEGSDPTAILAYAEFLDRYRDPEARNQYERALRLLSSPEQRTRADAVLRRLMVLDLLADDRAAAARHLEAYRNRGGAEYSLDTAGNIRNPEEQATVEIVGPLRSFARMAALSPDLKPEELLPALARNVVTNGYQASSSNEALEQTEYLKLVVRYLSQARELDKLAGAEKVLKIETCESTQTGELLRVLGYRMRGGCGSELVLETVNATRAFLTIDSGFPLAELEQALRTSRPFTYEFRPIKVPVLYGPDYWLSGREKQGGDFIDAFIGDPSLCRLYLGLSKLDGETAGELRKAMPLQRIKAFAHVLDFYGSMFEIRNGEAQVPGGTAAAASWRGVTGVDPKQGAAFFERLLTRDDGWMASFYDAVARISGPVRDYLLDSRRLNRFYMAIRGKVTSPGPARPVFRANTDMLLLTQRLRLDAEGRPHIPGSVEVWRDLFIKHPHGKYDGKLTRLATTWKEPEDVIEALFALCRKTVENEPLKMYMALADINRLRSRPLETATVERLLRDYRAYGSQYAIFAEAPTLSDKTMLQYLDSAQLVSKIRDQALRADAAGTIQGLVGLWQIFVRQGAIAADQADATLAAILGGFAEIRNSRQLFDGGRAGALLLVKATNPSEGVSAQDRLIDVLAGTLSTPDSESHRQVVESMIQIFEAQRLVSLNSLFEMADHLEALGRGEQLNSNLLNRLAAKITEIQLPRASLSTVEKNTLSFGYWTEKHIEMQRKVNLRAAIERSNNDKERLAEMRGLLAPFLRDTLVGLNYIHYAPPGAQVLLTNPVFVRSHDFLGVQGANQTWRATEVFGSGWPSSAGGRLVGSLSGLPYALAEAEQNFLIPSREQALIWGDLVPQMILTAKVPRWWNVTPSQLHWVGLHIHGGESLIAESALNAKLRAEALGLLPQFASPARVRLVEDLVARGRVREAIEQITPSELYNLAREFWAGHPGDQTPLAAEVRRLAGEAGDQVSPRAISRAFGTPKPTLANSYRPELLHLRTFPTLMGYSSRIMAESWESNLLYYAALADEIHLRPSRLNIVVPEWTQLTVERIFATHLEDWPALLRSLRRVGDDVRQRARRDAADRKASLR